MQDDDTIFKSAAPAASLGLVIDAHGHSGAPKVDALVADRSEFGEIMGRMAAGIGAASMKHNAEVMLPRAGARFASLETRLADMDRIGIHRQVVAPSPHMYHYWADEALATDIMGEANAALMAQVAQASDRLIPLGLVSMQHPALAVSQIQALAEAGAKGIEISSSVGPLELSHTSLDPIWQAAEAAGMVVFIHPLGTSLGARLDQFYLSNSVGQPAETTIALSHMIFSGVFDRFPALKVLAAHGGGYLPYYVGRSDHAWTVRPEAAVCDRAPSDYLNQIWFDTVLFDDTSLAALLARVGSEQVLFGTDYPFDMGDYDLGRLSGSIADKTTRDAVLGGNAAQLFGLG